MPALTIGGLIIKAQNYLASAGIENPKADVLFLLAHVLGTTRSKLQTILHTSLTSAQTKKFNAYLLKRARRIPAAYIIGEWDFMGLTFKINKNALIPRPETELIAEAALSALKKNSRTEILDFCTGSGCIGLSIAKLKSKLPLKINLLDISAKALSLCKKNAGLLAVKNKCKFILSDGFAKVPCGAKYNVIVSNPPYIMEKDFAALSPEVKKEPKIALTAKGGGLYFYKIIADNAGNFLYNGGCVIVELNSKLDKEIFNIFRQAKFNKIEFIKGYDGTNIGLKAWTK